MPFPPQFHSTLHLLLKHSLKIDEDLQIPPKMRRKMKGLNGAIDIQIPVDTLGERLIKYSHSTDDLEKIKEELRTINQPDYFRNQQATMFASLLPAWDFVCYIGQYLSDEQLYLITDYLLENEIQTEDKNSVLRNTTLAKVMLIYEVERFCKRNPIQPAQQQEQLTNEEKMQLIQDQRNEINKNIAPLLFHIKKHLVTLFTHNGVLSTRELCNAIETFSRSHLLKNEQTDVPFDLTNQREIEEFLNEHCPEKLTFKQTEPEESSFLEITQRFDNEFNEQEKEALRVAEEEKRTHYEKKYKYLKSLKEQLWSDNKNWDKKGYNIARVQCITPNGIVRLREAIANFSSTENHQSYEEVPAYLDEKDIDSKLQAVSKILQEKKAKELPFFKQRDESVKTLYDEEFIKIKQLNPSQSR